MTRRPRFSHGVIVAACLALAGSILVSGLGLVLGGVTVIKLSATAVALAYLLHTLKASHARSGRILTLTAWSLMTLACLWLNISLPLFLLIHAGAIWLIRAFHAYASLVPAILDACLSAFAVLAFAWAFMRTGSVLLSTWCFFLVQALWVFIPRTLSPPETRREPGGGNDSFDQAKRRADAALRKLFSQPG